MAEYVHVVNDQEVEGDFPVLPHGDYVAIIEDSEFKPTKADQSVSYLNLTYQILEGLGDCQKVECKGTKVFEILNLNHTKENVRQIAVRSMNSIGLAVGVTTIQDTAQLHDIPLVISITVKDDPEYGKKNIIKRHHPYGQSTVTPSAQVNAGPDNFNAKKPQPWDSKKKDL
jgi:hypothetical protein